MEYHPKEDASTQATFNLDRSDLSLKENLSVALKNEEFIDTIFIVGPQQTPIKCHRIILTSQSPVFSVMFGNTTDSEPITKIQLPETDPEVFQNLIKFLYTENIDIRVEDAVQSCALAKEYHMKAFITQCKRFLRNKLDSKCAIKIFQQARKAFSFDLEKIVSNFICKNAKTVFTDGDFREFSYENLCEFLRKDELVIDEYSLFKAAYAWAENQCIKKGKDPSYPVKIREALNEAFYLIRYPLMTTEEFVLQVVDTGLFSSAETYTVLVLINLPKSKRKEKFITTSDFSIRPRNVPRFCVSRFDKPGTWLNNYNKNVWAIRFKADQAISVVSLGLYGPSDTPISKYHIKVEILNEDMTEVIGSTEVNMDLKIVEGIFHVEFTNPVILEPLVWYTATFFITKGHATVGGAQLGKPSVCVACCVNPEKEIPVTFEFQPAKSCNTDFQIPELCFQLTK